MRNFAGLPSAIRSHFSTLQGFAGTGGNRITGQPPGNRSRAFPIAAVVSAALLGTMLFQATLHAGNLFEGTAFHHSDAAGETDAQTPPGSAPHRTQFRIAHVTPHDPGAYTQGLVFSGGFLYESTGKYGASSIRKVEIATGRVLKIALLPRAHFGEGLTLWRDRLIQLTWRSKVGFVYDRGSFSKIGEFRIDAEGWGLTSDGKSLIMSDGTDTLRFLDPETFAETGRLAVSDDGDPVWNLNELEYIDGEIFANIWFEDVVARISPQSGAVLGWLDLSALRNFLDAGGSAEVLNGIAWDPEGRRLFVTGKYWPKLFELELVY